MLQIGGCGSGWNLPGSRSYFERSPDPDLDLREETKTEPDFDIKVNIFDMKYKYGIITFVSKYWRVILNLNVPTGSGLYKGDEKQIQK